MAGRCGTGRRLSPFRWTRNVSRNTLIALALPAVSVPLAFVATGLLLWKWDRLRDSRAGIRGPMSLALFSSAVSPGVVLWIVLFFSRYQSAGRPLLKVAGRALHGVVYVYALAVLGSSRALWSALLVLAVAGWVGSIVTRRRGAFVAAQCLTLSTSVLPPSLLGIGIIPYVGP